VGGKKGHDGGTLKMVPAPDVLKMHTPGVCARCGQIQAQNEFTYGCLADDEAHIKTKLLQSEVVQYDETGFYVGKDRFWEHVASNEHYTTLFVHPRKGVAAHQTDISILPSLQNWAVQDCWSTYFNFTGCQHAFCGAHLLREFTALIESGSNWAQNFHVFLLDLYERSDKGG
jgi:transposase